MNIPTIFHFKPRLSPFNVTLWGLQILATLAFLVAGPLKLMANPINIQALVNFDATQWFFYLSGSVGGLKLLKQTHEAIVQPRKLCPNMNHVNK